MSRGTKRNTFAFFCRYPLVRYADFGPGGTKENKRSVGKLEGLVNKKKKKKNANVRHMATLPDPADCYEPSIPKTPGVSQTPWVIPTPDRPTAFLLDLPLHFQVTQTIRESN